MCNTGPDRHGAIQRPRLRACVARAHAFHGLLTDIGTQQVILPDPHPSRDVAFGVHHVPDGQPPLAERNSQNCAAHFC